jgi:hypothetical protein
MTIQDFLIADAACHAIPRMQAAHPPSERRSA